MYCRECGKQIDSVAGFCKYCGSPQITTNNSQQQMGPPPPNWGNPPPNWGYPPPNWGNPQQNSGPTERMQRNITNINFHNPKRGKIFIILGIVLFIFGIIMLALYVVEMAQYPIGTEINLDQPFTYLIIGGIAAFILGKIVHWTWND